MQISASVETAILAWMQVAPVVRFVPSVRKIEHSPVQYGEWTSNDGHEFRPIARTVTLRSHELTVDLSLVGYEVKGLWTTWYVHQVVVKWPKNTRRFAYNPVLGILPDAIAFPNRLDLVDLDTGIHPYQENDISEFLF